MYAVVRLNSFEANKLAGAADSLKRFDQAHAAQPGYVGASSSTCKTAVDLCSTCGTARHTAQLRYPSSDRKPHGSSTP
jgi:hypothetical protein